MALKILLITNIFPPDIGGPATFIDSLGHALHAQGHKVTVVCTSETPSHDTDRNRPYKLIRLKRYAHPLRLLQWITVFSFQLLRHKIVLVNGLEYQTARIAHLLKRSFVLKVVGDISWESLRNNGDTALSIDAFQEAPISPKFHAMREKQMFFVRCAQRIIVPSEYMNRLVSAWSDREVHTILNGVPLEKYLSYPINRRNAEDRFELVFVGRLTNWKGVESLLLAVQNLENVHLNIIGTGPELPLLVEFAGQLKLTNVTFHHNITGDALRAKLTTMHALALTSSYEGLSHTLIEACAMGLPCITSDCGGNPEVITHDENGYVAPFGDIDAIRESILKLAQDETLRYRLAENARQSAQRFDFDKTVQGTVSYLTKNIS